MNKILLYRSPAIFDNGGRYRQTSTKEIKTPSRCHLNLPAFLSLYPYSSSHIVLYYVTDNYYQCYHDEHYLST
ncbi:hypothetical protein M1N01_01120, partial [Thermodesulfovibrionales bacterium]|nr:hypothetical protein [Thermodesulfovibrionales bacterium]